MIIAPQKPDILEHTLEIVRNSLHVVVCCKLSVRDFKLDINSVKDEQKLFGWNVD